MTVFPILYVTDVEASARFYERAFGFERTYTWTENDVAGFIALRRADSHLGLGHGEGRGGFELCVYVDDVDDTSRLLRDLGAREVSPPADQPWGERLAYFDDADGHRLHVTAKIATS